ncbi:Fimbrin, actin-bundling protein [Komagataella phaffii CBS 7435]|uniref:Fimbrin n=2 Tax=Komagataella phaffii TaxID=460519 RepID=C4R1A0_KOMPG|nr:Fimbrin, actin-bundling protein [Komagataella phaffii GS115]CAH2448199.1 Putative fimbrin [Komagataella phaffii CBS 7435]CAY69274.1 Fimbrin, actin-bundling protein [Komagataella phaffii GS115]CCA38336.1 Fimbrin, actin-bundling protein [Komagataella phaffii CBS 7435]
MSVLKLQKKYPVLTQEDLFQVIDDFRKIDLDDKGWADKQEVIESVSNAGHGSYDEIRETLKTVSVDASGHVELEDFVELVSKLKESKVNPKQPTRTDTSDIFHRGAKASTKHVFKGASSGSTHTINDEERVEFTRHINSVLAGDPDIGDRLPFPTDSNQIFDECSDGLVLSKLINDSVPDTIDTRVLNFPKGNKKLNNFTMSENANIVINSAKAIGCVVVNVHSEDIIDGREHLILGIIWQIIRRGLLSKIDIKLHPELYRLLEDDETLEQFLRLPPEQILLRWVNYHLKAAGTSRRISNFSKDVSDGEAYTYLLNQLQPQHCDLSPLKTSDLLTRASQILDSADRIGVRKYLTPTSLVAGNPKLNLAFVAHLFNTYPGLDPIEEEEKAEIEEFDAEGEREARVFTLWLNSLDVDPPIVNLFEDLKDGTILLQAFDKVMPGSVSLNHVNKRKNGVELSRFKALENTNYAVEIGKANNFSLVGIEGADIVDGTKTLTLGLVWQLMRRNINNTLSSLSVNGKEISDREILQWANAQVAKGGKSSQIRSFKEPSLSSGIFLLDVLHGLKPGYVDYDLVTAGSTEEDRYANAKLAISIARKLGALIWLVPEDINEVRPRLILTFIGSLMALEL